jgi:Rieske Fe-S protein
VAPDGRPPEAQPAWRGDFPVDWPQDQYVGRREFTKFMVLTSFAFVIGQICIGIGNWFRSRRPKPDAQKVATLREIKELEPGKVKTFHYPSENDPCLLVRLADDAGKPRWAAYDQRCTHLSCGVIPDPKEPDKLFCPCHHGYFDCATGRPVAGPPRRPLPLIELEVRGNDIYAVGVKERTV